MRPGDVLREGNAWRVVRHVTRFECRRPKGHPHLVVGFAIRRCSWTGAGYTLLDGAALKQRKFEYVARLKDFWDTSWDRELARDIEGQRPRAIRCCEAVGHP